MREWGVNESKRKTVSFDKELNLHGRMPDVGYAIYKVCISECRNLRFATAMTDVGAVSTRFPYFHTKIEWKLKTKMDYCLALNIMLNDIIQWCWWQRGVRYVLWELRDCIIEWYMLCHIYRTRLSSLRSRLVLEFIIPNRWSARCPLAWDRTSVLPSGFICDHVDLFLSMSFCMQP